MGERLFIGVMSGTSCDGADAALVRVSGGGPTVRARFVHLESVDYTPADRLQIAAARVNQLTLGGLGELAARIAEIYAGAVQKLLAATHTKPADIVAIAAHGQTIFHSPPTTWQLFNPTILAGKTGIDVVSDFRRADCAAGGQGAPLVPFGDWVMFRTDQPRVILNVGGISNITVLPANGQLEDVIGYDVGPGNCLSDWLMRDQGGVDTGGERALRGRVLADVAHAVLADPFFGQPAPKSLDTPAMIELFASNLTQQAGNLDDQLATANFIVARAILNEVRPHLVDGPAELFIAGGGVRNASLMHHLATGGLTVRPTDELDVPTQAREAAAFALLAAAFVDRWPCYMPRVTGATLPVVLGSLTPKRP
jgi:anhydro-N-acetylmuramic acid kinase